MGTAVLLFIERSEPGGTTRTKARQHTLERALERRATYWGCRFKRTPSWGGTREKPADHTSQKWPAIWEGVWCPARTDRESDYKLIFGFSFCTVGLTVRVVCPGRSFLTGNPSQLRCSSLAANPSRLRWKTLSITTDLTLSESSKTLC